MDNCRSFARLAPHLVQHLPATTELVALDFPGHGWSSHESADSPQSVMAELAFYVAEAVKEMHWDHDQPITLIGHSMGAHVTSIFAAAIPERALCCAKAQAP
jgi:pimeloyl-ACP methyl ester carboxylesterase